MPGEDGYSLMRRIRALEREQKSHRTPAVALTAFVNEIDERKALAAGFDRHLGKPIEPHDLFSALSELMAER